MREDVLILKTLADSLSGFNRVVLRHPVPDSLTKDQTVVKFLTQDLSQHQPDRTSMSQKFDLSSIADLLSALNLLLTFDLQSILDLLSTPDFLLGTNLLLAINQEGNLFTNPLKGLPTFHLYCHLDVYQFRLTARIISGTCF